LTIYTNTKQSAFAEIDNIPVQLGGSKKIITIAESNIGIEKI
jgi:hypothetical protein